MEPARWQRLIEIFTAAAAAPAGERAARLADLCGSDAELRREVEGLLAADASAGSFLESSAAAELARAGGAEPPELMPLPARIGRYEIQGRIGRGGFGDVYRALDPALKRTVAIKTCVTDDPAVGERFVREAEIAAGLDHPCLTKVFDFGIEAGTPYLVQEFLGGEDLSRLIARRPELDLDRRLRILLDVARGLAYVHGADVTHRDVKPGNVRVLADGHAKLMDFGIARRMAAASATRTGTVLGTLAYMAPEQLRGAASGAAADVWALGVLSYELLAYRHPFAPRPEAAPTAEPAPALGALHEAAPPLTADWPTCPPDLARFVARCLRRDPRERFPDAAAALAALEEIAHRVEGTEPFGAAPTRRLARTPGRRGPWAVLAALILALVAAVIVALRLRQPAAPTAVSPAMASGRVEIDARPWATVTAIVAADGRAMDLPAQAVTPLALALPPGEYVLTLRHPQAAAALSCRVRVEPGAASECRVEFYRPSARELVARLAGSAR